MVHSNHHLLFGSEEALSITHTIVVGRYTSEIMWKRESCKYRSPCESARFNRLLAISDKVTTDLSENSNSSEHSYYVHVTKMREVCVSETGRLLCARPLHLLNRIHVWQASFKSSSLPYWAGKWSDVL